MRRWIAALTGVAAAALITSAPAATADAQAVQAKPQAKPAGPLEALTRKLVKDHGVKISNHYTTAFDGKVELDWREAGKVQLSPSGRVAADLTSRYARYPDHKLAKELAKPSRDLEFAKESYGSGPYYEPYLPEGKTWIRFVGKHADRPGPAALVDVFERATLKSLLSTTSAKRPGGTIDGTATTLYTGTTTYGAVYKASRSLRQDPAWKPSAHLAKQKVSWKLWLGKDLLARRLVTTYGETFTGRNGYTWKDVIDTRYSSWGAKVVITPPPAADVIDESDLGTDVPDGRDFTTTVPSVATREQ